VRRGEAVRDPAAWVWRAAFRIAAGQLAVRRRSGRGESPDLLVAAADTLPDDVVVLLDALGRLPEADRRVVVLSLVGGLPAAEVGRVVGATAGAVRVRLRRARRALMATLAPEPAREEP
jgi:RNA polymerase sigma-70 factor, ECF subfamily